MLYDGVLKYDYGTIVSETDCYVDQARRIVTLSSEEAMGLVEDNNVIVIYDITDNKPIVLTERCEFGVIAEEDVRRRVDKFNNKSKDYVASIDISEGHADVTVTRRNVYDAVEGMM